MNKQEIIDAGSYSAHKIFTDNKYLDIVKSQVFSHLGETLISVLAEYKGNYFTVCFDEDIELETRDKLPSYTAKFYIKKVERIDYRIPIPVSYETMGWNKLSKSALHEIKSRIKKAIKRIIVWRVKDE